MQTRNSETHKAALLFAVFGLPSIGSTAKTATRKRILSTSSAGGSRAEFVSRYFRKGSMIIVEGKLQNADYTDSNGVKHYAMDVQADNVTFGESKNAQNATQSDYNSQPQNYQPTPQTAYSEPQTQPYSNPMQDVVDQSQNVVHTYEADVKNAR